MAAAFKNVSKFRFVKLREDAKQTYSELRVSDPTSATPLAVSARWLAVNWGSLNNISRIGLLPAQVEPAQLPARLDDLPVIAAHNDSLGDMAFSPFHADLLLTGSKDTTVKASTSYRSIAPYYGI